MKKVTAATAKMAVKDDWVVAAMTHDEMVVELLIRLKHAGTVVADNPVVYLPPLRWGIRQRRSRSSRFGVGVSDLVATKKKDVNSARASPNTPLSWSGGSGSGGGSASPSAATADGFEDTSRQASCSTSTGSGSKVFATNEITSCSLSKRLKRKKSSSELKNEENMKLKERVDLEKELASLRSSFDEQNLRNQRLKRIKLDLNSGRVKKETPVDLIHKPQQHERLPESKSCNVDVKASNSEIQGSFFFIPDLNMAPSEEDILYGTS